jgi:hypothetical protein
MPARVAPIVVALSLLYLFETWDRGATSGFVEGVLWVLCCSLVAARRRGPVADTTPLQS